MKKSIRYLPVLLLGLCMAVMLSVCLDYQLRENLLSQVQFLDTANDQRLVPVYNETEEKYYLYLPSYSLKNKVKPVISSGGGYITLARDREIYKSDLSGVPLGVDLTMSVSFLFYHKEAVIQIWQCGPIPSLHIEGQEQILDFLHETKENKADVRATFYDSGGKLILDDMAAMYGRGNSTWWMGDKRPYNLAFNRPVSVGPFEDVSKLNLLAEYYDQSKMRNALVYYAGGQLEIPYSPEYMLFDLFINGEYMGIYGATTKEEYTKHLEHDQVKGVFTVTSGEQLDFWPKLWSNPIRILYGDWDDTWETIFLLEKNLERWNWKECIQRIDIESFARKYVMEEFFANTDVGYASQYFYIDQNDVIHCMMPWDYDLTLGNTFFYYNNKVSREMKVYLDSPNWYGILLENEQFRQACLNVLETEFTEPFINTLENYLTSVSYAIAPSWQCDRVRWKPVNLPGIENVQHLEVQDYPAYFAELLRERADFLEDVFRNWDAYCVVSFIGAYDWKGSFCIPKGDELAPYLENASILDRFSHEEGWVTEDGLFPGDVGTVTEDITFVIPPAWRSQ